MAAMGGTDPTLSAVRTTEPDALTRLARQACALSGADAAVLYVRDSDDPRALVVAAAWGGRHEPGASVGVDEGPPGRVMTSGEAVTDAGATYVPVLCEGALFGVLAVEGGRPATDAAGLEDLAALAGELVARSDVRARLERTLRAGISALAELLDLRDGYTASDTGEVVELARLVGERLGLSPDDLAELVIAARVHDVGKIGVPDSILLKPGALDPDERAVMERHAVWGAETLARIPGLERVADTVRAHHERWDGQGYPSGLSGEAIPLQSRIIGACEAYRAMTSDRPYRGALGLDRAVALLRAGSGTHFDPAVIDALVEAAEARGERGLSEERQETTGAPRSTSPRAPGPAPEGSGAAHALPRAFERLEGLPALAESRDRLLALLRSDRVDVGEVVGAVESDVALVIAILRLANGARTSGRRARITTVPQAVEALTPEGVEELATRIATVDFFDRLPGWPTPPEPFRLHAVAVQRAATRVAREVEWPERDELLVSSLLHDVGKLVLAQAYPGYPGKVLGDARTPEERLRAERRQLGLDHAMAGGVLVRRWDLPERLADAIGRHHDPQAEGEAAILRLADMLAHYGAGRPVDPRALLHAARALELDAKALRAVLYELPAGGGTAAKRNVEPCPLTDMELRALRGLAEGKVYKEIATDLNIAVSTVRSHLHKTYKKIGAADRAQAVLMATERGWL
jgi:putative nucleotidyltransferase with HDIG domain